MKRAHFTLIAACVLALLMLGFVHLQTQADQARLQAELAEARIAVAQTHTALESSQQTSAALQSKLVDLAAILNETTDKLQASSQNTTAVQPTKALHVASKVAAEPIHLPPPRITSTTDASGKESRQFTFPKVFAADGRELATDATFASMTGRRLIFRFSQGPPVALDVDQVHPEILLLLGIDPDSARQAQYEIDQQKRAQAEAAQRANQAQLIATQRLVEQEAAQRRDQAREAEAQRKLDEERAFRMEVLDIERQKAQAALRNADAAMVRAISAVPVIVGPTFGGGTNTAASPATPPALPQSPGAPGALEPKRNPGSFQFLPGSPTVLPPATQPKQPDRRL